MRDREFRRNTRQEAVDKKRSRKTDTDTIRRFWNAVDEASQRLVETAGRQIAGIF